jgi:hypothetical protein
MTPKNLQTPEELHSLAGPIYEFLKQEVNADDIEVCITRGHKLTAYMANTGKMLADAKYWRDQAISRSVLTHLKDSKRSNLPASTLNELVKAETRDFNYLVNWIEQLDKDAKYQLEWLRTCVSKEKAQMYLQQATNSY